jgi:hypothetical protein
MKSPEQAMDDLCGKPLEGGATLRMRSNRTQIVWNAEGVHSPVLNGEWNLQSIANSVAPACTLDQVK